MYGDWDVLPAPGGSLARLITIDGLALFSLDGVTIPVPTISPTETTDIYLHPQVILDPDPLTLPFSLVTIDPGPANDPNDSILGLPLYSFTPSVNIPAFDLPIPVLSDNPPDSNPSQAPLLSIPEISIGQTPLSGGVRLDDLQLGLKLKWKDGQLGIWVVETGQFIAFDSLPLPPIPGVISVVATPV